MRQFCPNRFHESAFPLGMPLAAAIFIVLVSALTFAGAQTTTSHAAEIHDHLRKAAEYLKAKDPDSAVKEFDAVLALDPKNAEAYANLGVVAFFRRDYLNASQYLHKAVVIDPSLVKSQGLLGICERRLGDPSARVLLEKSFSKLHDKSLRLQVGLELASLYDQQGETGALASIMQSL